MLWSLTTTLNPHVLTPIRNKGGRPRKQQKITHVPGEAGGTIANVPMGTAQVYMQQYK